MTTICLDGINNYRNRFAIYFPIFLFIVSVITYANEQTAPFSVLFDDRTADAITHDAVIPATTTNLVFDTDAPSGLALCINSNDLSYPIRSNYFNINDGSVSFWVKPKNWGNGMKLSDVTKERVITLFAVDKQFGQNWTLHLYAVHSPVSGAIKISFRSLLLQPEKRNVYFNIAVDDKNNFARNKWTMVTLTWSKMEIALYVNGALLDKASYGLPLSKINNHEWALWFLPKYFWRNPEIYDTAIDTIQVFDRELRDNEVKMMFAKGSTRLMCDTGKQAHAPVPMSSTQPRIDGIINDTEWNDATRIPLCIENNSALLSDKQAWTMIKHDASNIYVACDMPGIGYKTAALPGAADNAVFQGSEFEVLWNSTGADEQAYSQVAVGANNAYMTRNGRGELNSIPFSHAAMTNEKGWSAEISIPLASMGIETPGSYPFQFGLYRPEIKDSQNSWIAWNMTKAKQMFFKNMGMLHFRSDKKMFRIERIGDINYGNYSFVLNSSFFTPLSISVSDKTNHFARTDEKAVHADGKIAPGLHSLEIKAYDGTRTLFSFHSRALVQEPLRVTPVCFPSRKEFVIQVDARGLERRVAGPIDSGTLRCRMVIDSQTTGKIHGHCELILTNSAQAIIMPFQEMPEGKYNITATLSSDSFHETKSITFDRPSDVFLKERKGLTRDIPRPWSPINRIGETFSTAFHTYKFGNGPFPQQIFSHGSMVLSAPPQCTVGIDGKTMQFTKSTEQNISASPDAIVDEGICLAKGHSVQLQWKRTFNYDGMIRYDFAILADTDITINTFAISMEIPDTIAKYALTPNYNHDWTKNGEADVFPIAWLTDNRKGFALFTDNDANWVYPINSKPIKLTKAGGRARIIASIIQSPVTLKRGTIATYVLGMMATPGKPPRNDWRAIHCDGWGKMKGQTHQTVGWISMGNPLYKRWYYFPDIETNGFMYWEKRLSSSPAKNVKLMPYGYITAIPDKNPIHDYYGSEWRDKERGFEKKPFENMIDPVDREQFYGCVPVSVNNQDYIDYVTYYIDNYLKACPAAAGTYQDGSGVDATDTPYRDTVLADVFNEHRKVYNNNLFGMRELYERLYKITRERRGENGYVWIHSWDKYYPPVISFVDMVYPGEEFMHSIQKDGTKVYVNAPCEQWQANYSSSIYGVGVQFLSQYRKVVPSLLTIPSQERKVLTKPLLMMCLLHDVQLSGAFYPDVEKAWSIFDSMNASSADFLGYWQQEHIVAADEAIKASYYKWTEKKDILLLLGNFSEKAITTTIKANGIDLKSYLASDPEDGTSLDLGRPLSLEDFGFRIIRLVHK